MSALLMDNLSVYEANEHQHNENLLDTIDNTIKLQLKKPQIWNWELSTSKSSPNIAFPKIQLYNDKGDLLAETQESENVFNNQQQQQQQQQQNFNSSPKRYPSSSNTTNSNSSSNDKKSSRKNSSSTSSTSVKIKDKRRRSSYADIPEINEELNDFVNNLKNENLNYKFNNNNNQNPQYNNNNNSKSITNLYELDGYNDDDVGVTFKYSTVPDMNYNEHENNSISTHRYRDLNNNNKSNKTNRILRRSLSNKLENFSNKLNNDYYDNNNNDDDENYNKNIITQSSEENPIWIYSAKGLIQRDMNAKEFNHLRKRYGKSKSVNLEKLIEEENLIDSKTIMKKMDKTLMKEVRFDLKKSKSTTDIITGRDKKKCRRTNSNNNTTTPPSKFSKSILERMSASKMGTSTESQDIKITNVNHGPRYFLRTSKAGTLVVCEDNNYNRKTRRRPKSIPRISRNNDENDNEFDCSNNQINNNKQFYDNAINKLDYLIKNASLKETINSDNLLKVNNENLISQRGKSVEIGLKNKNNLNSNRKFRDIRRCVSAGNVCLSSDEDQQQHQQPKKEIKLRRKRKIHPVKVSKGDQILALNNTNLSSSLKNISSPPPKIINEKESDELLLCFVQNITSSINDHQQNELQEKNNFINNNISIEDDSILKENDENINFEIIKCSESINNKTPNYIILNNNKNNLYNNNNNNINNVNYCYPVDENIVELLSNSEEGLVIIKENMGSNVSRNSSKQQEPYHQSRRRTHSSGDIHNNKYNNSSYYNLLSNNPNDKLSTIPGYDQNNITTTNHQINNGDKKNRISSHDDIVDTTINHYIPVASDKHHQHVNQVIYKHNYQQHGVGNRIKIPNNYGIGVTRKDRNKFRGSLPNHLDTDIFINEDNIMEQHGINNPLTNFSSNSNKNNINQQNTDLVEYVTLTPNKQQIQHENQENNSPYNHNNNHNHNNSSSNISEKEAASTSSGCGRGVDYKDASRNGIDGGNSTLNKINQDKPDIQLTLPLARTIFDPSCDQGYGSERSPEDELPQSSILQNLVAEYQHQQQQQNWNNRLNDENQYEYNFITEDCTFSVEIIKGPRGLGLSISGGIDTNTAFPGLIRIKRLFPHQAAWSTGQLQQGDIILDANGISLTGLTNYEALEVLRTMPNNVILLICRPVDEQYKKLSPPTEPPKPPQRTLQQQQQSTSIQTQTLPEELTILYPVNQLDDPVNQPNFIGEFEIFMVKQQGSLGFTLRKEDDSVLGHYVRALVREPATSDGRIKPGDKIVAVNDVPLSPMSHEQAVIFLRQSGDFVKLRLYRDKVQTPIEPVSPTTSEKKANFGSGKKIILRPEAINLLTDLAHKKQNSLGDSTESSNISSNSSPRRLKRGHKSQSSQSENTDSKSSSNPAYLVSSQTTLLCSDSEQSIDSQCSYIVQPADINESDSSFNGRNNRPQFLNLNGDGNDHDNSGNVAAVVKKPNYQFAACTNTFELNNLDNDALDAPIFNNAPCNDDNRISNNLPPELNEFTSLPCEALLNSVTKLANNLKDGSVVNNISHKKNPLYQSVHHVQQQQQQQQQQIFNQQENNTDDDDCQGKTNEPQKHGNDSFIKWKDVGLPSSTNENDNENSTPAYNNLSATTTAGENCCYNEENKDKSLLVSNEISLKITEGYKMLSVELNRGWNSRLGFSLQPDPNLTSRSIISAIYGDSVAARDGRLRAGDILVSVNDESVKNMSTSDIIDFLRIIRGAILITVLRKDP